ncbi:hypothetical protein [Sphingobacterium thalpophilum]|uniref:hypothetical protein n=1 Tax=Sphingobacterium thalpophilum TaxID=259 RepID=UPI0024A76BE1|nr:hypothetical protein [Sphingobacterium thalpophilum]
MKFIFTLLILSILQQLAAQDYPQVVPFKFNGELKFMDIRTTEEISPETWNGEGGYYVGGDFKSYIVNNTESRASVIDARTGKEILSGRPDNACGELNINKHSYYHFESDDYSLLLADGITTIPLNRHYTKIEPNSNSWDNGSPEGQQYVWALKDDGTYDVLNANSNFTKLSPLPIFDSFDLIYEIHENEPMTLIGFALGNKAAIRRDFAQQYNIPESAEFVDIYDIDFNNIGKAAYQQEAIGELLQKNIQLRGSLMAPPSMRQQVIVPGNTIIILNDEFSLVPAADHTELILVNTKEGNSPVLGKAHFDYRYISTSQNLKALLQIRHAESGSFFYFDFNGLYFPRGIPLIPQQYRQWEQKL